MMRFKNREGNAVVCCGKDLWRSRKRVPHVGVPRQSNKR